MNLSLKKKSVRFGLVTLLVLCGITLAAFHQVDVKLTQEDKKYIQLISSQYRIKPGDDLTTYKDQLHLIRKIQGAVIRLTPRKYGIPFGNQREPKDIYEGKTGLCYDRSRLIEKMFLFYGLEARHVALYSKQLTGSTLKTLFSKLPASHSLTEVHTVKGWLVVDSNKEWLSLKTDFTPVPLSMIQADQEQEEIQWEPTTAHLMNPIYQKPFTFIYGLYSRHGQFYPPYNFIPDVNWKELSYNLMGD